MHNNVTMNRSDEVTEKEKALTIEQAFTALTQTGLIEWEARENGDDFHARLDLSISCPNGLAVLCVNGRDITTVNELRAAVNFHLIEKSTPGDATGAAAGSSE